MQQVRHRYHWHIGALLLGLCDTFEHHCGQELLAHVPHRLLSRIIAALQKIILRGRYDPPLDLKWAFEPKIIRTGFQFGFPAIASGTAMQVECKGGESPFKASLFVIFFAGSLIRTRRARYFPQNIFSASSTWPPISTVIFCPEPVCLKIVRIY